MSNSDEPLELPADPRTVDDTKAKTAPQTSVGAARSTVAAVARMEELGGAQDERPGDAGSMAATAPAIGKPASRGVLDEVAGAGAVLEMLTRIGEETKRLREEFASLNAGVWIAQAEALKSAATAAAEYRTSINDLGISLDAIGGQFNRFASGLSNLTAVHPKFVREQKERTLEVKDSPRTAGDSHAAPAAEEKRISATNAQIARPQSNIPPQWESNPPVKGLNLFGQAEAIVASGSATPQQQQFLANLASVMSAHNLTYQQAIEYFKLNENNLQTVMNILEQHKTAIANFAARLDNLGH
jgi:hypothetical protein